MPWGRDVNQDFESFAVLDHCTYNGPGYATHNHNALSRSVPGTHSCEPLTGMRSPLKAVGLSASATNKQRRYDTLCAVQ